VIEYRRMEQMQEQPLHWDNHRTNLNLTFIFALIVAVIGILGQPVLFVLGIGVAIYSWLTNPKQYLIYRDALVIVYGRPRIKSYPFQEISHLETLSLPIGERLRVRMVNGRRIMLLTKDPILSGLNWTRPSTPSTASRGGSITPKRTSSILR